MTVWRPVILTVKKPLVLLVFPGFQPRVTADDLCDLAVVQALAAATTPGFALAMDQPDLTESLPGIFARSKGSFSLGLSIVKLLLANVISTIFSGRSLKAFSSGVAVATALPVRRDPIAER